MLKLPKMTNSQNDSLTKIRKNGPKPKNLKIAKILKVPETPETAEISEIAKNVRNAKKAKCQKLELEFSDSIFVV